MELQYFCLSIYLSIYLSIFNFFFLIFASTISVVITVQYLVRLLLFFLIHFPFSFPHPPNPLSLIYLPSFFIPISTYFFTAMGNWCGKIEIKCCFSLPPPPIFYSVMARCGPGGVRGGNAWSNFFFPFIFPLSTTPLSTPSPFFCTLVDMAKRAPWWVGGGGGGEEGKSTP